MKNIIAIAATLAGRLKKLPRASTQFSHLLVTCQRHVTSFSGREEVAGRDPDVDSTRHARYIHVERTQREVDKFLDTVMGYSQTSSHSTSPRIRYASRMEAILHS